MVDTIVLLLTKDTYQIDQIPWLIFVRERNSLRANSWLTYPESQVQIAEEGLGIYRPWIVVKPALPAVEAVKAIATFLLALTMSKRAHDLFMSPVVDEKRQLMTLVFQNMKYER